MLNGTYNRQTSRNSTIPENIEELVPSGPCSPIFSGFVKFLGIPVLVIPVKILRGTLVKAFYWGGIKYL